jgi:hypothetical protein
MFSCDHLYHPSLNDPGTSQDQRLPAALSADSPAIDDRQISDFLNYFAALSHQINFYDAELNVSDWGPFFSGDMPFVLSAMAATDKDALKTTLNGYTDLFKRRPTVQGLQLLFLYSWYSIVYPIQEWAAQLQGSGLPLEQTVQTLIRDRLTTAIRSFIQWMNTAVKCFCIRPVDMNVLLVNSAWGLTPADLTAYNEDFSCPGKSRRNQLLALQSALSGLTDSFAEVLNLAGAGAADQVNEQFYDVLLQTGQQIIRPHLALLYAFLNQFLYVLDDLNGLTEKHLNYFFQNVLRLAPGNVVPDKAYVVFSVQKQVPNYLLAQGLSLKDGKDANGADIYFALDAPIVVTQTQATAFRTLFVNTPSAFGFSYVEGVYMAPDATKADGLTQAFPDAATASWPTLGARVSQYTPPMAPGPIDYPMARLGFALASKVLLLNEGDRTVNIHLNCRWTAPCGGVAVTPAIAQVFMDAFSSRWLIITPGLIDRAVANGVRTATARALRRHYLLDRCRKPVCKDDDQPAYLPYKLVRVKERKEIDMQIAEKGRELIVKETDLWIAEDSAVEMEKYELEVWKKLLAPEPVLNLSFSGPKGWVVPESTWMSMEITDVAAGEFTLDLYAQLGKDQDAVTFFDKSVLGEDLGTTDPLVKVELNDAIKVPLEEYLGVVHVRSDPSDGCCLAQQDKNCGGLVSYYTFFRNVLVLGPGSHIRVNVCGVKDLVVQNDDNVLSAKKPFTPFGVKPIVPDFDILANSLPGSGANLVGPNFYVGSAEVFLKKWHRINVNLNWKGKPKHLWHYYRAYVRFPGTWHHHFPRHRVRLALLHDGNFSSEPNNRHFFAHDKEQVGACPGREDYHSSFSLRPDDFGLEGQLSYDPTFAPLSSYSSSMLNGFLRVTMEDQDFLHKVYPIVMAEKVIARATTNPHAHLPNEPWTPTVLEIAIDYEAQAKPEDMQLIQLYPYNGTYKKVDINGEPTLFATFCDEGNLFVGLSGLVPGDGLNMLFAFAEATAETEGGAITIDWYYLAANQWVPLRTGFEIIRDNTNGLSTTGIVQYHFPDDISEDNTILPAGSYWIMASVASGAAATSRTKAIVTQAALASFINNTTLNDQTRPGNIPLRAGSIAKLATPDPNIASVTQPYDSFGGHAPETLNNLYTLRVSEHLRHKGRAIQKWDYERMVLQEYPKVLRAKCINHSYALSSLDYRWDFPMAPGNILIAVLPDPTQLAVTNALQPTVPMSLLTDIETWLAGCASPFVRLFVRNARYEPIDMCLRVALQPGLNGSFYQSQLERDIRNFMAPWKDGNTDAFQFGQRLYSAGLVQFIEGLDYIANLLDLEMCHQGYAMQDPAPDYMEPLTPRSILVAGKIVVRIQGASKKTITNGWKQ